MLILLAICSYQFIRFLLSSTGPVVGPGPRLRVGQKIFSILEVLARRERERAFSLFLSSSMAALSSSTEKGLCLQRLTEERKNWRKDHPVGRIKISLAAAKSTRSR